MNRATLKFLLLHALLMAMPPGARAAETQVRQPEFLEQYAATYRFSLGRPAGIQITRAGDAVLFLRSGPRSFVRDLYEFDVAKGTERLLASADKLLAGSQEELSDEEKARRERMRLAAKGIASFELSHDGRRLLIPLSGRLFLVERATGAARELSSASGGAIDARFSPDGRRVAYVRGGELFVLDIESGESRALTHGATETLTFGLAEFVAQEEMGRMHGYWWSPDSQSIVFQETDTSEVETLYIADPAHPERPAQSWRYPRPGKNNARVRLGIVPASGGEPRWINWDREAFPYLAAVEWDEGGPPLVLVQNREQTVERLLAADPATGATRELLTEKDDAWLNLDVGLPRWLPSGEGFLWSSERSGNWQLELRAPDGALVRPLTTTELNYRHVLGFDKGTNRVLIAAGAEPTESHVYCLGLSADAAPVKLTTTPGVHAAVVAEENGAYVLTTQTLDADPKSTVHARDGRQLGTLKSVAETTPLPPRVELTTVGTSPTLHAAIIRPSGFDAERKHPVLVSVYGGPHSQTVLAARGRYLLDQWLAEQGFIVVSIDGRGTPARGRAWERAIRGNLIDVPLADQVAGLRALAAKYPQLDLERVGIYGWSFGGYFTAMAVMREPDVFQVGVAGAPVTDWRDYDTHYTERYLGLPGKNERGYEASSVLTYAAQLRQPLLLVHGTADDNVYFLHSIRLADALFRARRDFEFLPLSGLTHMVPDPVVTRSLYTRIAEHFLKHLGPTDW
ncbi:MAG TPA: DPP IV N-terminal domain-containing protein [Pirellulales bacterium]|nr:DPP IV N-terminal domain-containing protein [Pirellulales bacterium]